MLKENGRILLVLLTVFSTQVFLPPHKTVYGIVKDHSDLKNKEDKAKLEEAQKLGSEGVELEKAGQFEEALDKYLTAEAISHTKEASDGVKRVQERIKREFKVLLTEAEERYQKQDYLAARGKLEEARKYDPMSPLLNYNLALIYSELDERSRAIEFLDLCIDALPEGKKKEELEQLRANTATPETPMINAGQNERAAMWDFNRLIPGKNEHFRAVENDPSIGRDACIALRSIKGMSKSPSWLFNMAKCAEMDGSPEIATGYVRAYLSKATTDTVDRDEAKSYLSSLETLAALPADDEGIKVRQYYANAARYFGERRYDLVLRELKEADTVYPEFLESKRRLALFYEMEGDVANARPYFIKYLASENNRARAQEAREIMEAMETKRAKYEIAIDAARIPLAEIARSFFVYGKRAPQKYLRDRTQAVIENLQRALSFFPAGAEAHNLLAMFYQLNNNYQLAQRSFDIIWSQGMPVYFYSGDGSRVEIYRDRVRIVKPTDGDDLFSRLGQDLPTISETWADAQEIMGSAITSLETKEGTVVLHLKDNKFVIMPAPFALPVPEFGPLARKFGNEYSKLFQRYLGITNVKLGKEALTNGEKTAIVVNLALISISAYDLSRAIKLYNVANTLTYTLTSYEALHLIKEIMWILRQRQEIFQYAPLKLLPARTVRFEFRREL